MVRPPLIAAVLESLGANVRRARQRRAITQEQLAELAELDVRFVQRIEAGRTNVGIVAVARLALALDVPPSVLLRSAKAPTRKAGRPRKAKVRASRRGAR